MYELNSNQNKTTEKRCSVPGCDRPYDCKGYCQRHYLRMKRGVTDMRLERIPSMKGKKWKPDDVRYLKRNDRKICSMPNCENKVYAKDLCHAHYEYNRRTGSPWKKPKVVKKCKVDKCGEFAHTKGYCMFHYKRKQVGIELSRPKGVKGELNIHWNGGVAKYPNHTILKKQRKIALARYEYKCQDCGGKAEMVHHKDGSTDNHDLDNLIPLCYKCHAKYRKPFSSKYKRKYGRNIRELGEFLNIPISKIIHLHKQDKLKPIVDQQIIEYHLC